MEHFFVCLILLCLDCFGFDFMRRKANRRQSAGFWFSLFGARCTFQVNVHKISGERSQKLRDRVVNVHKKCLGTGCLCLQRSQNSFWGRTHD